MSLNDANTWLSKIVPALFGITYTKCKPVVAGRATARKDIVNRELDWESSPKPAVFYNLEPDTLEATKHGDGVWSLDYVLGSSDATDHERRKISDGDFIYWRPYETDRKPRFDDAVLVAIRDLEQFRTLESAEDFKNIHEDWLCLKRIGHEDGRVTDEEGKVFLRSLNTSKNSIEHVAVDRDIFRGFVFGKYKMGPNSRIRVAPSLPFQSADEFRPA